MVPVCAPRKAGAHTGSDSVFPPRDTLPFPSVVISASGEKLPGKILIASAAPVVEGLLNLEFVLCRMKIGQEAQSMAGLLSARSRSKAVCRVAGAQERCRRFFFHRSLP